MKELEKLKVGDYVRTIKGKIFKVKEECYYDECFNEYMIDGEEYCVINIVKHSQNIIDLIEVGDYLNGQLIEKIHKKEKDKIYYEFLQNEDGSYEVMEMCEIKNIKSIVTKEQFENMEYRLEK